MKPYGFIYITENLVNGKRYIGQKRYVKRWEEYLGSGKYLLRAIRKYGIASFRRTIIFDAFNQESLNDAEIKFIKKFDAVKNSMFYNLSTGGQGATRGFLGRKHTQKTKEKMRQSQLGHNVSKAARRAIGTAHKGKKRSLEDRIKQAATMSGANHPRARSVTIEGTTYKTLTEAIRKTGLKFGQVRKIAETNH